MALRVHNLFETAKGIEEKIHPLHQGGAFVLEQIVSHGQASEPGFWYDQPKDEWVVLLRGRATLEFKDDPALPLQAGDALLIPAHCIHRVASTSRDARWIALHFESKPAESQEIIE